MCRSKPQGGMSLFAKQHEFTMTRAPPRPASLRFRDPTHRCSRVHLTFQGSRLHLMLMTILRAGRPDSQLTVSRKTTQSSISIMRDLRNTKTTNMQRSFVAL